MPLQVLDEQMKGLAGKLNELYGNRGAEAAARLKRLLEKHGGSDAARKKPWVTQNDVMLITYGDSILDGHNPPLAVLRQFLRGYIGNTITAVHVLPFYPYTSDDGFSVSDYRAVDPALGTWQHVREIAQDYDLMFDSVVNHISRSSDWFQAYLRGETKYRDYFIEADPAADHSMVTRPRTLPLLTKVKTADGEKHVWTTFSDDQIDLNFQNPDVLLEILDILLLYAGNGARFIRLDAIGFLWKVPGTSCMHLPGTHAVVKIMREVLDIAFPGTFLITETNVPHHDNISYFGNGSDEAQMVYQFPLPPLTLFSFHAGHAGKLMDWAEGLEPASSGTAFFNFLASHDGIGMRPTEGILSEEEKRMMVRRTLENGGRVSYRDDGRGGQAAYELNISYMDALTHPQESDDVRIKRFLAAHTILLSVAGVPGIYIHSLLGSQNDYEGLAKSGINRRINREKLDLGTLTRELEESKVRREVYARFSRLIRIRRTMTAFDPRALQRVERLDERVFSIERSNPETGERVLVLVNVSTERVTLKLPYGGEDRIGGHRAGDEVSLSAYQCMWIQKP